MSVRVQPLPEKILLATLHKVGPNTRLVDDFALAKIFNDAAESLGSPFKPFAWHRHYRVSELLSESLQVLDSAGSIVRENASQTYFRVSPHTAGPFGSSVFESLEEEDQLAVEEVAERIRTEFGNPDDLGQRD